nr:ankyrin repeat domain-containing protein [Endozoicomonas sp.]
MTLTSGLDPSRLTAKQPVNGLAEVTQPTTYGCWTRKARIKSVVLNTFIEPERKLSAIEKSVLAKKAIKKTFTLPLLTTILPVKVPTNNRERASDEEIAKWFSQQKGGQYLHTKACAIGLYVTHRALINAGVDIDHKDAAGNTALMHTVMNKNTDIAIQLLDLGADYKLRNNSDINACTMAIKSGNVKLFEYLIKIGCSISQFAIFDAIKAPNAGVLVGLILKHYKSDYLNRNSSLMLIAACNKKSVEVLNQLLSCENIRKSINNACGGATALDVATSKNWGEGAKILRDNGGKKASRPLTLRQNIHYRSKNGDYALATTLGLAICIDHATSYGGGDGGYGGYGGGGGGGGDCGG